ncbi:MAG: hypothetical protein GF398_19755 [Chitinivibrionales bacterium]|nr:hypothetical protein [Chitinivibrionales bacterium]
MQKMKAHIAKRKDRIFAQFMKEQIPNHVTIEGNSMYPVLRTGECIAILPLSSELVAGECYAYLKNGVPVLHRLVGYNDDYASFVGDNTSLIEEISRECIIGKTNLKNYEAYENIAKYLNLALINMHFRSSIILACKKQLLRLAYKMEQLWQKKCMRNPKFTPSTC